MKQDCTDIIIESGASIGGHLVASTIERNKFADQLSSNFGIVTFESGVCNIAIFGDREFILPNYTLGFLVPSESSREQVLLQSRHLRGLGTVMSTTLGGL